MSAPTSEGVPRIIANRPRVRVRAELFAAGRDDPLGRRPSDAVRAVALLLVLALACVVGVVASDLDAGVSRTLVAFPHFLHVIWLANVWLASAWALLLLVLMVVRRRPLLAAEALLAAVVALAGAVLVAVLVGKSAGDVLTRFGDLDGPPMFPPAIVATSCAILGTLAPRLTVPFRRVGRVLIVGEVVGVVFLGASVASGAIAAVAVGLLAGTMMHLIFGSPGGFPTASRVQSALADLGVPTAALHPVLMGRDGFTVFAGTDDRGPVRVKVYGRDAWDGEAIASTWRRFWIRGAQRTARLSRVEYVEHEGFMTFLAQRAGARVPQIVTAGMGDNGDALIATRPAGTVLDSEHPNLSTGALASLWHELETLHGSNITHRRIDLDRVVVLADGTAAFDDLASATVQHRDEDELIDHAQLLALGIVCAGEVISTDQARAALGDEAVVTMLPYFQDVALPPGVRNALRSQHVSVDEVRKRLSEALGATAPELTQLRRVTWKSFVNLALLSLAMYTLIVKLSDIDFGAFFRALRDAEWPWLAAALVVGQLPRITNAIATIGSTTEDLPFGPTALMQFASTYINLAVPSSAGRIALTTRYYQRFGAPPATALAAGTIHSLGEFVTQVALFGLFFFVSDIHIQLSLDQAQLSGIATTALIVILVLVAAVLVALIVRPLRERFLRSLREAREALDVLRSPTKLLQLVGGNLASQLLFALTLAMCARAFGVHLPLSDFIVINIAVALFAGLIPVPGDVGVYEGGLSLGLTRVGVPADIAFAIALSYRFVVFYLPPLWGYLSLRWLTARRYL